MVGAQMKPTQRRCLGGLQWMVGDKIFYFSPFLLFPEIINFWKFS
jgi:hypothetical protein